jgi:lactoylglutathione lyase
MTHIWVLKERKCMRIEHIALSTEKLEEMSKFYELYFQAKKGEKYENPRKGFESYFLSFDDGTRIELMRQPSVYKENTEKHQLGYCHLAMSVGSALNVEQLTEKMEKDGITIVSYPRFTGDGYYESVVLDPDGNQIEITV